MNKVWLDGKIHNLSSDELHKLEAAEGVFETLRYRNGSIEYLPEHLQRLHAGEAALGFSKAQLNYAQLFADLLNANAPLPEFARVRLLSTKHHTLAKIIPYTPFAKEDYKNGIDLALASHPSQSESAQIKCNHRQGYLEAFLQAKQRGFAECLFIADEKVLECSMSNVIVCHQKKYFISPKQSARLAGVMEQKVLSALGSPVIEADLSWPLPFDANVYITSSLKGIVPVKSIEQFTFSVDRKSSLYQLIGQFWPYKS